MALRTAAGVSLAYILLPMFFVIWLAFFAQEIPSFPPEGYSLKWFRAVPGNDRFVNGISAQPAGRRGLDLDRPRDRRSRRGLPGARALRRT